MTEPVALARLSQARQLLAEAKDLADIKAVRDVAEAARLYARAAGIGADAMNEAAEIKLRAERKAGEALAEMKKRSGGDATRARLQDVTELPPTLQSLGISKRQSSDWQAEASVPEPLFNGWVEQGKKRGEPLTSAGLVRIAREEGRFAERRRQHQQVSPEPSLNLLGDEGEVDEEILTQQVVDLALDKSPQHKLRVEQLEVIREFNEAKRATRGAHQHDLAFLVGGMSPGDLADARRWIKAEREYLDALSAQLDRPLRAVPTGVHHVS